MKKLVVFAVVAIAAVSFVSCNGNKAQKEETPAQNETVVVDETVVTTDSVPAATNDSTSAE